MGFGNICLPSACERIVVIRLGDDCDGGYQPQDQPRKGSEAFLHCRSPYQEVFLLCRDEDTYANGVHGYRVVHVLQAGLISN